MEILRLLDASPVVQAYQVLDFRTFEQGWYYKIEVELEDRSVLHAREYADEAVRNYAYHWQDAQDIMRVRWDNAPHHEQVATYPHHKHVGDKVLPNKKITLEDVLRHIETRLQGDS